MLIIILCQILHMPSSRVIYLAATSLVNSPTIDKSCVISHPHRSHFEVDCTRIHSRLPFDSYLAVVHPPSLYDFQCTGTSMTYKEILSYPSIGLFFLGDICGEQLVLRVMALIERQSAQYSTTGFQHLFFASGRFQSS